MMLKVTIADSECTINSATSTQIICETGSYSFSSVTAPIQVSVKDVGKALNVIHYHFLKLIYLIFKLHVYLINKQK